MILGVMTSGQLYRIYAGRYAIILSLVLIFFSFQAPAAGAVPESDGKAATKTEEAEVRGGLIDINHATASELKTLPGIRDAYAAAIVKNRPYKNKAQLLSRQVIPEAAYGKIRNKIIARQ